MSNQITEFKALDTDEQKEVRERATESLSRLGKRPLQYVLAYLSAQRQHEVERLVTQSHLPPESEGAAAYGVGEFHGRMATLDTLIGDVNIRISEKEGPEETSPLEGEDDE